MAEVSIKIKGARVNNLKNIDLELERGKLITLTGVSGSGKSSLAFDTLYAEGQRRYVESLSAYARQFLGRVRKPDVDSITGIPPAIAIEQKVNTRNVRSTLGTSTELYDFLRLLYWRIGRTFSPISGVEVKRYSPEDVLQYIISLGDESDAVIMAPCGLENESKRVETLLNLQENGFSRFCVEGSYVKITELLKNIGDYSGKTILLVVDRVSCKDTKDNRTRILDSLNTAFGVGEGVIFVGDRRFSSFMEADGMKFVEPTEYMFSFNSPLGACPTCNGYGNVVGIDETLVVPNPDLSIYEDAIACWRGQVMSYYKERLILAAPSVGFPIHKPYKELTPEQRQLLWKERENFIGLDAFFEGISAEKYKIQNRVMLSRYTGKTVCPECGGARLRKETLYVKIGGKSINQLLDCTVDELNTFFNNIEFTQHELDIAGRIITEIRSRLEYLSAVGLGYLTINRPSNTLSGGESQRVNLVSSLGSSLVGALYILDEPSIGLHPRDTQRLISTLKHLRDVGNTVLVVEHDEEIMRASDEIVDIGPLAGVNGGRVMYCGRPPQLGEKIEVGESRTLAFLSNPTLIGVPSKRRKWHDFIELNGVSQNNLKDIDVKFPLGVMTAVTGVSGSGKSSLVRDVLYPAVYKAINMYGGDKPGRFKGISGDLGLLKGVEMVDQTPIGKSSRSNPVTYLKVYDDIRKLFSEQPYAKMNGFGHSHFSFNIDGGRCPECQGEGIIKVEMQFMADVVLTCEACGGKRFKSEILDVKYRGKNIYDVLEMSVEEAVSFFGEDKADLPQRVVKGLQPLIDVGLSYVKLGQNSSSLSGGESQRIKLASFLGPKSTDGRFLFIFDEPTTGLHYYDIAKLLKSFDALVSLGHSIVVIEHNMEVVKCADWIIDIGPEAGDKGGNISFAGTPEDLVKLEDNYTAKSLKDKL